LITKINRFGLEKVIICKVQTGLNKKIPYADCQTKKKIPYAKIIVKQIKKRKEKTKVRIMIMSVYH